MLLGIDDDIEILCEHGEEYVRLCMGVGERWEKGGNFRGKTR